MSIIINYRLTTLQKLRVVIPEVTPGFLFTSSRCELFYKLHVPLETCAASNFIMNVHKKSNRKSTFPH